MFIQAALPLPALAHPAPQSPENRSSSPFGRARAQPAAALPSARGPGRSDLDIDSVRSTFEAEYLELRTRSLLERARVSGRGGAWTLDPYRGCEWEDPFEAQRFARRAPHRHHRQGSRQRIFVKSKAAAVLGRQLRSERFRGRSILIGAGTDPYQPAEKHFGVTRSILEELLEFRGLNLSIETRSPLIARDLDLLAELDTRHTVEVSIRLAALHPALLGKLEPRAPSAEARLRTLGKIAREGLSSRLSCDPLLPGINTSEDLLRPLFTAALEAGARDVTGTLFSLPPSSRSWFFPWLEREFPNQAGQYRQLFGWRDHLSPMQHQVTLAPFQQLRLEMGFPRPFLGRG